VIRWARGGEAAVTALDGDRIAVLSTTPSAPGSRPEGALVRHDGGHPQTPSHDGGHPQTLGHDGGHPQTPGGSALRIKVARCRRQGDRFLIEGRLLDATRETRAEIQRLLERPSG